VKKRLVALVFVMLATALLLVSCQRRGGKIRLAPREVSPEKVHSGSVWGTIVSSDCKQ